MIPKHHSLYNNSGCDTVSNTLEKSRKMTSEDSPWFAKLMIQEYEVSIAGIYMIDLL